MNPVILPTQDAIQGVYDFKNILECMFKELFIFAGLDDSQIIVGKTPVDFQSKIPRVEVSVRVGQALKQWVPVGSFTMNYAWEASVTVRAVTKAGADGKEAHAAFRSLVQYICEASGQIANGQSFSMTTHKISWPIIQTGSSDVFRTKDSYEYSDQTFSFRFNIAPAALQALATAQQPQ